MSKFLHRVLVLFATAVMPLTMFGQYQLPDPGFEDWSGTAFDGQVQNKYSPSLIHIQVQMVLTFFQPAI